MQLTLQNILPDTVFFKQAMDIYHVSFPANEKQPVSLLAERISRGDCSLQVAIVDQKVVGMALVWVFKDTRYGLLDYLAVKPEYRGSGIGAFCMKAIQNNMISQQKILIIEVEDPAFGEDQENKLRRIDFYERCGALYLSNTPYMLPALDGTTATPMLIFAMVAPNTEDLPGQEIKDLFTTIFERVYGKTAEDALLNTFLPHIQSRILLKSFNHGKS